MWEEVLVRNEYRLPDSLAGVHVTDVGSHIGAFAEACLMRGARFVAGFEPCTESRELARRNLEHRGNCGVSRLAVWRSDVGTAHLTIVADPDPFWSGSPSVVREGEGYPVTGIPLDSLMPALRGLGCPLWLKLDCEGAEWPILFTSRRLRDFERILGEFHETPAPPPHARVDGFPAYDLPALEAYLTGLGFDFESHRNPKHPGLGLFWARKHR